jgi:hypothetical protein
MRSLQDRYTAIRRAAPATEYRRPLWISRLLLKRHERELIAGLHMDRWLQRELLKRELARHAALWDELRKVRAELRAARKKGRTWLG